jgi:hypothetical protein
MKTTLKNILTKSGKFVGTLASFITIENLIRDLRDQNVKVKYESVLNRNKELESKVINLLEDKIINEENKGKILELVNRRSNSLEIVREDVNKLQELNSNLTNTKLNDEVKENLTNQINQNLEKLSTNINKDNNNLSDLIEFINNLNSGSGSSSTSSSFINNFNLSDLVNNFQVIIDSYQKYLSNITLEQKLALTHILISTTIFFFLCSLIGIYYSDYLIKTLTHTTLVNKYPILRRILIIRKNFQEFFFFLNSLFILFGLIIIIYINYLYLTLL